MKLVVPVQSSAMSLLGLHSCPATEKLKRSQAKNWNMINYDF